MNFNRLFTRFANQVSKWTGRPVSFALCVAGVVAWTLTGPTFHYSQNWQLVINTSTTIVTFLMVLRVGRTALPQEFRHAVEVRHPSFNCEQFFDLAAKYNVAIVYAEDDEAPEWPRIDQPTADFTYARLMSSRPDEPTGMTSAELDGIAAKTRDWAKRGDVFAYFIAGAKERNPAAAMALIEKLNEAGRQTLAYRRLMRHDAFMAYWLRQHRDGQAVQEAVKTAIEAEALGKQWEIYGTVNIELPDGDIMEFEQWCKTIVGSVSVKSV